MMGFPFGWWAALCCHALILIGAFVVAPRLGNDENS